MQKSELLNHMNWLGGQYPQRKLSDAQLDNWWQVFQPENAGVFRQALERYVRTAEVDRAPTIGQICRISDEIRHDFDKDFGDGKPPVKDPPLSADEKDECGAAAAFLVEVLLWHNLGLVQKQASDVDAGSFDMDKWRLAGKSALWSPILTHAYSGLSEIWHQPHADKAKFYRDYTAHLVASRTQRTGATRPKTDPNVPPSIGAILSGGGA